MKWIVDYLYPKNYDHDSIPDLDRKVVIVTGGAAGLGYEVSLQCALHNVKHLIIIDLPSQRLEDAVHTLSAKLVNVKGKVDAVPTDLADLSSVFATVRKIRELTDTIDILFANAGIGKATGRPLSVDGIEPVFAINHVGHYALVTRLLPTLLDTASKENADVRVVITSSILSWYSKQIKFETLTSPFDKGKHTLLDMYNRSKLANLLFGLKLAQHVRELGATNLYVNVAEPGMIFSTGVHLQMVGHWSLAARIFGAILRWTVGLTVAEGALTLLYLGTSPKIKEQDLNGQFFSPFGDLVPKAKYPKHATEEQVKELWEWSEEFVSSRDGELVLP